MPSGMAVEFGVETGEYRGVVQVPRRVFQRLLPELPTPERCVEDFIVAQTRRIQRSWPHKDAEIRQCWANQKRKSTVKRLLLATAVVCLLTAQTANAKGCLRGAALGGVAGHMAHHTFLGIFGGCAGGLYVHHLYTKWKKTHPDGSMNEFVSDNKDYLPKGWDQRLTSVGDTTDLKAGSAGGSSKNSSK